MTNDWLEDESLTREEKIARFEKLSPEPTRGPSLPGGGVLVTSVKSFNVTARAWSGAGTRSAAAGHTNDRPLTERV